MHQPYRAVAKYNCKFGILSVIFSVYALLTALVLNLSSAMNAVYSSVELVDLSSSAAIQFFSGGSLLIILTSGLAFGIASCFRSKFDRTYGFIGTALNSLLIVLLFSSPIVAQYLSNY